MLQNIRQHATGWISWVLVGLISAAFALWGVQNYITSSKKSITVAKVNHEKISEEQLNREYRRVKQNLSMQYGEGATINDEMQKILQQQTLNQLISREILAQYVTKSHYKISGEQLLYALHHVKAFQFDGKFSYPRFRQVIGAMGYTEHDFLKGMDQDLMMGQLQAGIMNTAFATPNEVEQAIILSEQKRDFQYAIIPASQLMDKIKLSEEAINSYYEQHKNEYVTPDKVQLEYVILPENEVASKSEELTELAYTNSDSLKPIVDALKLPIKTTETITREGLKQGIESNPKVLQAAFSDEVLNQSNNSQPIEIEKGALMVLRVKERFPSKVLPLDKVRDTIVAILKHKEAVLKNNQLGKEMLQTLQAGGDKKVVWHLQKNASRQQLGINKEITDLAFRLPDPDAKKQKSIDGQALANGDFAIVQLLHILHQNKDLKLSDEQRKTYNNTIRSGYGQMEFDLLVKSLMDNAKISINLPSQ